MKIDTEDLDETCIDNLIEDHFKGEAEKLYHRDLDTRIKFLIDEYGEEWAAYTLPLCKVEVRP